MGLEDRLKRLESKVKAQNAVLEPHIDIDQCIAHLGLDPAIVRDTAHSNHSNLAEAMCEMLGIELKEFKRHLREVANPMR